MRASVCDTTFYGKTGLCIFYGRTGLCIILVLRVVVAKRHTPAIDHVVTTDTLSFLYLLVDKKRMLLIKDITKEYETIFNEEDPEHEPSQECEDQECCRSVVGNRDLSSENWTVAIVPHREEDPEHEPSQECEDQEHGVIPKALGLQCMILHCQNLNLCKWSWEIGLEIVIVQI